MFDNLSDKLSSVLDGLTRKGALSEDDVSAAMREVRLALLEADVALPVVRTFIRSAQRKATGQTVMRSVSPGNQVIKIVHDELVRTLEGDGKEPSRMRIDNPPAPVLMVGLQGSGKTTTTAKIAKRIYETERKRVLMASLDTRRPAAMEQLEVLGRQANVNTLSIVPGQPPVEIAKRAMKHAADNGYDAVMLDTAGRMHIDDELMDEVVAVREVVKPKETLLVVDGLTGQDAVNVASEFEGKIGISGVVLTRMEGDGRGGAALSMRAVTGKPIKFVGIGEKLEDLGDFDPERVAGRILGMGDIVALVEKARETLEVEKAERAARRLQKGLFNMNDMRQQLESMQKMGGMSSVMSMMPGMGKLAAKAEAAGMDDRMLDRQLALINSMTRKERANPKLLQASRRKRIAAGAGLDVAELNKLLKMHRQFADMSKAMSRGKSGLGALLGKAGLPAGAMPPGFKPGSLPAGLSDLMPGGMGMPGALTDPNAKK